MANAPNPCAMLYLNVQARMSNGFYASAELSPQLSLGRPELVDYGQTHCPVSEQAGSDIAGGRLN